MSGTEQSGAYDIISSALGTNDSPTVAGAIVNWEIATLSQYGAGYGLTIALAGWEISAAVGAGVLAAAAVGQITDYLGAAFADVQAELGHQADIMGAVNLDGMGLNMPDPVSGMGYLQ